MMVLIANEGAKITAETYNIQLSMEEKRQILETLSSNRNSIYRKTESLCVR